MNARKKNQSDDFLKQKAKEKKSRSNTIKIKKVSFLNQEKGMFNSKKTDLKTSIFNSQKYKKNTQIHLDPITSPTARFPASSLTPFLTQNTRKNPQISVESTKSVLNFDAKSTNRETSLSTLSPIIIKHSNFNFQKTSRSPNSEILSPVSAAINSPKSGKELNLMNTPLEDQVIYNLYTVLQNPRRNLTYLNLENTGLANDFLSIICESLSNDRSLTFLGLARNGLTCESTKLIKDLVKENSCLRQLDLHWNSIKDQGCLTIFEGLCFNGTLKELDLSWNGIGRKDKKIIHKMALCFEQFLGLAHLDLSFNYFNAVESEILGKGLEKNHEIIGFHFFGNEGVIDSIGFLSPFAGQSNVKESHLFSRIFQRRQKRVPRVKGNCWLCEEWTEFKFQFSFEDFPEQYLQARSIFIHFECDSFQANELERKENSFEVIRVMPQGALKCFFSVPGAVFILPEYEKIVLQGELTIKAKYSVKQSCELKIKFLNILILVGPPCDYKVPLSTLPRISIIDSSYKNHKSLKPSWSIESSIFKDQVQDFKLLIPECIDFDWSESRLVKLIKRAEDMASVKELLQSQYLTIINLFKHLSTQSSNEYPSIGSNVLTEFLNDCDLLDEFLNQSDLGVIWNSVIVPKTKQPYNPGNALVRYEFTELLVRISIDRFIRHKKCKTVTQSVNLLISNHLTSQFALLNTQTWRTEKLLNQKVDILLKAFKPVTESAFKIYSGKKTLPGQKAFMSLDEFRTLCTDIKVIDSTVPSRDVDGCFYLAKRIEVNELFYKRHIEMDFVEFLEGFCRACDMSSFSKGSFYAKVFDGCKKLMVVCPKGTLDNFVVPSKEMLKSLRN